MSIVNQYGVIMGYKYDTNKLEIQVCMSIPLIKVMSYVIIALSSIQKKQRNSLY